MSISMKVFARRAFYALLVFCISLVAASPAAASASLGSRYHFAGPVFGLSAAPDGSLLAADAGAGIVELRKGKGRLVAALPGVSDVAAIGRGDMLAITGGGDTGTSARLFRVSRGEVSEIANLGEYEQTVNPDSPEVNPNPFDVEVLNGGKALVVDAGGNDLLVVDMQGNIDWIATFPEELVSTENAKTLANCPNPPSPDLAFVCGLPDMMPAQAVPTSVAVGPDGAYYVGELKGFPGAVGVSRIWRIEPGTLHAECGNSPACSVVASGFTSIVDLAFGLDGKLYVTEMDEASFLAVELAGLGLQALVGGTINTCDLSTWTCLEVATGLVMPVAVAVDRSGTASAVISALMDPEVVTLQSGVTGIKVHPERPGASN